MFRPCLRALLFTFAVLLCVPALAHDLRLALQATGTAKWELAAMQALDADIRFGAPPLVNELLTSGQAQAALNLWNWNARARLAGKVELVSVPHLLAELGLEHTPPLLGWAFAPDFVKDEAIRAFLDASFETKAALLADDALWDKIRPAMNNGGDDALFARLRDDYRAGIVTAYGPDEIRAAEAFIAIIASQGGLDAVGGIGELAPGAFWEGYAK